MQDFSTEIANERVTSSELTEILSRLSAADLGGSDLSKISDIAEATNQSAETVAILLAEIRGETVDQWRQVFQAQLARHEQRLNSIDGNRPLTNMPPAIRITYPPSRPLRATAFDKFIARNMPAIMMICVATIFVCIPLMAILDGQNQGASSGPAAVIHDWNQPERTSTINDHKFGYDESGTWSEEREDGFVGPIKHPADSKRAKQVYNLTYEPKP
ncbi:hypothetical protein BH11ARM1_BH11ARM1_16480 [soil metagenome]